jgi:hypothetical protein
MSSIGKNGIGLKFIRIVYPVNIQAVSKRLIMKQSWQIFSGGDL